MAYHVDISCHRLRMCEGLGWRASTRISTEVYISQLFLHRWFRAQMRKKDLPVLANCLFCPSIAYERFPTWWHRPSEWNNHEAVRRWEKTMPRSALQQNWQAAGMTKNTRGFFESSKGADNCCEKGRAAGKKWHHSFKVWYQENLWKLCYFISRCYFINKRSLLLMRLY
jgi:hypothetical protein